MSETTEEITERWIPVTERVPCANSKSFLVTYSDGSVSFASRSSYDGFRWRDKILNKLEKSMGRTVVAWKETVFPYKAPDVQSQN